jgi:major membrane immunogen (membrane-anchored lipoprotein)
MMNYITWILFLVAAFTASSVNNQESKVLPKDGTYSGSSRAQYVSEPFVGTATIKIENHKITKVEFQIADTLNHEVFGSDYEKHYPDNELYRQQCRNDWKGVLLYQKELVKKQNINEIDAVSGATWSYNIFKASVKKAFDKK